MESSKGFNLIHGSNRKSHGWIAAKEKFYKSRYASLWMVGECLYMHVMTSFSQKLRLNDLIELPRADRSFANRFRDPEIRVALIRFTFYASNLTY